MPSTTIVVGAGASVPFGLPTSSGLKALIVENPPDPPRDFLSYPTFDQKVAMEQSLGWSKERFAEELSRSGDATVDAWLGSHPSAWARRYGTFAIAATLLPFEVGLYGDPILSGDWHAWLFGQLKRRGRLDSREVAVVTFNYDCLLEWALVQMLTNSLATSRDQAIEQVGGWNVQHVYGALTWGVSEQDLTVLTRRPRTGAEFWHHHLQLADDRERLENTGYRERVWKADQLIFLGFAFDPTNLRRLGIGKEFPQWTGRKRRVIGTAFRLSGSEQRRVRETLDADAKLGDQTEDCLTLLQNRVDRL
ncbi:MAG: hypothetical protein JNM80_10470 [Phycisphaerae bacterium]|nr:hypothetical protein [Phycisphaerae bacterium]